MKTITLHPRSTIFYKHDRVVLTSKRIWHRRINRDESSILKKESSASKLFVLMIKLVQSILLV